MKALTPAERRGALVLGLLLALGSGRDLWRAGHPTLRALPPPARPAPAAADSARAETPAPAPPLDLNRASAVELMALPGIGPVLAERIVAHRRAHGEFRAVEDLLAVRGVGARLLERLRGRTTVGPPR
ncbi:MAG: hypothetical protein A2V63_03690 [Candidatus Eisenbacteria bacterium RBG_19FT_COMBO_70_11]|nr:MAG: hypothetical protein A2V63_03690 [Candidatus Eisenbacteria bacterium RBG_19FT_COMBO_70_11]